MLSIFLFNPLFAYFFFLLSFNLLFLLAIYCHLFFLIYNFFSLHSLFSLVVFVFFLGFPSDTSYLFILFLGAGIVFFFLSFLVIFSHRFLPVVDSYFIYLFIFILIKLSSISSRDLTSFFIFFTLFSVSLIPILNVSFHFSQNTFHFNFFWFPSLFFIFSFVHLLHLSLLFLWFPFFIPLTNAAIYRWRRRRRHLTSYLNVKLFQSLPLHFRL